MHIPDGFINGATSAGFGVAAAGSLGAALRHTGRYLDERRVPIAGLVAAFVFAAQMVNFPVVPGMSGHLIGAVLAAVLVGPWAGLLVVSIVVVVQGVVFADGGLSALGLNIVNLGLVGAIGGYAVYLVLAKAVGSRRVPLAAGMAAFASLPMVALAFIVEYAIGGTADVALTPMAAALIGAHALIGIGEGILTGLIVGAVLQSRPDLVYGAAGVSPDAAELV